MVFKEADKNGWGEARTIGTSLYLIFLNHEERVIATEMLFGGLHLLDDESYIIYAKKIHGVLHRCLQTPCRRCEGQATTRFMYLQCLAGRAFWPEKQTMAEEVEMRKSKGSEKRGFDGENWSEAAYKKRRKHILQQDMLVAKNDVVYSESEHDVTSLWESAIGHSGLLWETILWNTLLKRSS